MQILVPDLGDIEQVEVIEVAVQTGMSVSPGDLLVVWNPTRPPWKFPLKSAVRC